MSLNGEYDSQNIFACIIRGEAPCFKIYEDDEVLAFLDLFPQSRGHTLVIPKHDPARNLLEARPQTLEKLIVTVQKLAAVIVEELQPEGVQIMQFNGAPAGQTVFHLHMHIVPRWAGQGTAGHGQGKADPAELEALAERLKARIAAA